MAEINVFERDLAGAFLRLADDVTPAVDAAAVAHRVALEHPRRQTSILRWRLVAVPRLAWILLLLGAMLTAMVGVMLIVGSQRPAVVGLDCPAGTNPDTPGPVDQPGRPRLTWRSHSTAGQAGSWPS